MRNTTKITKSYSVDPEIDTYVRRTRGSASASERMSELLRRAIRQELYEKLEHEAAEFFLGVAPEDRTEEEALQAASLRSLSRD